MKTIFATVLFISICSTSFAQFQWLNPKPSGWPNKSLYFSDTTNGYILNSMGDLIRTGDGGKHWFIQQQFPNMKTMSFADSTGLLGGYGSYLYVSSDNGNTWQQKATPSAGADSYLKFIKCISRDTLFAINSNAATLYRSDDRGETWQQIATNNLLSNAGAVEWANSKTGYLTYYDGIYKTTDGGSTWKNVYPINSTAGLTTIQFFNANTGYAYREMYGMLKTTDGGSTWISSDLPDPIYSIFILSLKTVFAVGQHGVVYKSTNGGASWSLISPTVRIDRYHLYSLYFFNEKTGFVVGDIGRILKTTDGGSHWQPYSFTYTGFTTLDFPTPTIGYTASGGNIYKTTNAGSDWKLLNFSLADENDRIRYAHFRNKDTGFVISEDQVMFHKTHNGGKTWKTYYNLTSGYDHTTAFYFINDTLGYAAFDNYTADALYRTTDGGETWKPLGHFYHAFTSFFFLDAKTGFATSHEKILRTDDSAKTWNEVDENTFNNEWFSSIAFINPKTGYAVGELGLARKTNDSGRTWQTVKLLESNYDDIFSIKFFNEQVGYLNADAIYKTIDGGKTWKVDGRPSSQIRNIAFAPDTVVYIAGDYGNLLKSQIAQYNLEYFSAKDIFSCNATFSVIATAVASTIDSIWFEYGTNDFTNQLPATPVSVSNQTTEVTGSALNLSANTSYKLRVKVLYRGQYYYSNALDFHTIDLPEPSILDSGAVLTSSAPLGNQWFRNDTAIVGATGRQFTATQNGSYTVRYTTNGCVSPKSKEFTLLLTGVIEPALENDFRIYPNPTTDWLIIETNKAYRLDIKLMDINGNLVKGFKPINTKSAVSLKSVVSGIYVLWIMDSRTKRHYSVKLIKR